MKRQYLPIGGVLLATTALSTTAMAGTFGNDQNNSGTDNAALTARSLSAQVFGGTAPENIVIGPTNFSVFFTNSLTASFDAEIESSNSDFTGGPLGFQAATAGTGGSLTAISFTGCTVQLLTERILIQSCVNASTTAPSRIDAISLSNVSFNEANGLATAGTSIALSGIVRGTTSSSTFELLTSANLVTSANVTTTSISSGGVATINNASTIPFAQLSSGGAQVSTTVARLGTVTNTLTSATGTNLATTVGTNFASAMEFVVTHGVLTDTALTNVFVTGNGGAGAVATTITPTQFASNVATFNFGASASFASYDIRVTFNGSTAISAWSAGSVTVSYTGGVPSSSGSLASFSLGGFNTTINYAQSSVSPTFLSYVRLTNTGSAGGSANILVRDSSDGSTYGTFTTELIEGNSTLQVGMDAIESALGITSPPNQFDLTITSSLTGYAQHILFNSVDNFAVDLSAFRNTGNP